MDFLSLFGLVSGLAIVFLAIVIYARDRKSLTAKNFLFMSASIAFWNISYSFWLMQTETESALFYAKILGLASTLVPFSYLLWVLDFLNISRSRKVLVIYSYVLTALFCVFSFSDKYVTSVAPAFGFSFWPQAGAIYICFIVFGYFGLIGRGFYELFKARKTAETEKRRQIDLISLASVVVAAAGASNFLPMMGIDLFPPLAQPFSLLYPIVFLFAIIRYHLFDVKLILVEFLVGLMAIILLMLPFLMTTDLQRGIGWTVFTLFCFVGYLLISATLKELNAKEVLEERVAQRTRELTESNRQFKKFYDLAIDRESKMIELKKEIAKMKQERSDMNRAAEA
jgi:hypothetical protein